MNSISSYSRPFFIVGLLLLLFATNVHAKNLEWYRDNGVNIVSGIGSAPMSYEGVNGNAKGFIIDYWRLWSLKTGIPVKFTLGTWSETLRWVATGQSDIHGGIFQNAERERLFEFSEPFHSLQAALVVRDARNGTLDTIYKKYRLGVLAGGYGEAYMLENHPESTIVGYPSVAKLASALMDDEVLGVVGDHPIVGFEVGRLGSTRDLLIKEVLYEEQLRAAVRKGDLELMEIVKWGMAKISEEEINVIRGRWFVEDSSTTVWIWDTLKIVGPLLLALIILFFVDWRRIGLGGKSG